MLSCLIVSAYTDIINLLDTPLFPQPLAERITLLKSNFFYRLAGFGLNQGLLRLIANKEDDPEVIVEVISELSLTECEKQILEQRARRLELLCSLYDHLVAFNKTFSLGEEDYAYKNHIEDLHELNRLFSSENVTVADMRWFFNSSLFSFLSEVAPYFDHHFDYDASYIYNELLENAKVETRKVLNQYKAILIEKHNQLWQNEIKFKLKEWVAILNSKGNELNEVRVRVSLVDSDNSRLFKKRFRQPDSDAMRKMAITNSNNKKYGRFKVIPVQDPHPIACNAHKADVLYNHSM
ncbi:hypothetical protein [Rickettsiella endosymbiont of Dermanyssus gallinae]|uniref:hypothetical protein n=1 Tax=Rickettsiella endosymbiont of Dermanyssus gallinae TaxID=2856608 RepID=UPI001C52C27E|nr:hypothetical protein [Rickettsiella endosymbiont of Dermanyssus gallinae]